jgi:hypothetical protein
MKIIEEHKSAELTSIIAACSDFTEAVAQNQEAIPEALRVKA